MSVSSCTRASAADLYTEPVIEDPCDKVMVNIIDIERKYPEPVPDIFCKNMQPFYFSKSPESNIGQLFFTLQHFTGTHFFFKADREGSFNTLQESGGSAIFLYFDICYVAVSSPPVGPFYR